MRYQYNVTKRKCLFFAPTKSRLQNVDFVALRLGFCQYSVHPRQMSIAYAALLITVSIALFVVLEKVQRIGMDGADFAWHDVLVKVASLLEIGLGGVQTKGLPNAFDCFELLVAIFAAVMRMHVVVTDDWELSGRFNFIIILPPNLLTYFIAQLTTLIFEAQNTLVK